MTKRRRLQVEQARRMRQAQLDAQRHEFQQQLAAFNATLDARKQRAKDRGLVLFHATDYNPDESYPDEGFAWSLAPPGITSPVGFTLDQVDECLASPDVNRWLYGHGGHADVQWMARQVAAGTLV
jgi:hypothetical protein